MAKRLALYLLLFAVSAGVKSVYFGERSRAPELDRLRLDARIHHEWATGLATGEWTRELAPTRDKPYFRAPLYPYFLAAVYRVVGPDPRAALAVQLVLGCVSGLMLFLLTRLLLGPPAGFVAFALYLGYWPLTYFEQELLIPAVLIPLILGVVILLVTAGRKPESRWRWLATGVALGVAAIARPNVLALAPVAAAWAWLTARRAGIRTWPGTAALVIGAVLAVAPVTVHNAVVGRDFVPIASEGGVNFYIGNHPGADGVHAVVPGTRADWWGGYADTHRIAEHALGQPLRESQVSGYWYRRGLEFLRSRPAEASRLLARKAALFIGNGEISNNAQLYFRRGRSDVLRRLPVDFAAILALSVVGLAALLRRRDKQASEVLLLYALAAAYGLSVIAFFVTSRYRLPVAVLLVPGAAWGATVLVSRLRAGRFRVALSMGAVGAAVFAASLWNPFCVGCLASPRGYYDLGVEYARVDPRRSVEALTQAIERDPSFAPAWKVRGNVLARMGLHGPAIRDLRTACRLDTTFVDAYYSLGVALQRAGRHEEARWAYVHAISLDSLNVGANTNLADVLMREGELEQARRHLERALAGDPDFPNALLGLAYYYRETGQAPRARAMLDRLRKTMAAKRGDR